MGLKYGLVACLFAVTASACTGSSLGPGEGAVELNFTDAPYCAERDGEVCLDDLAQFELASDSTEVTFESGPGGRYVATLPAGEYRLRVLNDDRCVVPDHVKIQEGVRHRRDIVWPAACEGLESSGQDPS